VRARLLVFYAAARLYRNQALTGEVDRQQISSYGVSLRAGYSKRVSLRLDLGVVDQGGDVREPGSSMFNASIVGFF